MNTLLLTIATVISSVFGVHAPVQQPVVTPDYVTKTELQKAMDSYVARIQTPRLGAAPSPAALATYTLAGSGVSSSATSITLTNLTIKQTGQKIITSDLRQGATDSFYITIEPGNTTRQEIVGCTGVTQNSNGTATLTGCSRGMSPIYPYTASSTLRFPHAGSSHVIFGDAPQIFNDFNNYVASAVVSGAVDSSATVKGIVEKATNAEAAGHAAIGSGNTTAPLALTTDIASSTRTANTAQVVVASSSDGYIDSSYIPATILYNHTFTATTTLATTTIANFIPMGLFASTSVSSGQTSMTLNFPRRSIGNLIIGASTTSNTNLSLRFNGDSGSNYNLYSISSVVTPGTPITSTSLDLCGAAYSGSLGAQYLNINFANVPGLKTGYANATCISAVAGATQGNASTTGFMYRGSDIVSVTVTPGAGNLGSGSFINVVMPTSF